MTNTLNDEHNGLTFESDLLNLSARFVTYRDCKFDNIDIELAVFDRCVFENCIFDSVRLNNSIVKYAKLIGCDFIECELDHTIWLWSEIHNINLTDCSLTHSKFKDVGFYKMNDFIQTNLHKSVFRNISGDKLIFQGCDTEQTEFINARMNQVKL